MKSPISINTTPPPQHRIIEERQNPQVKNTVLQSVDPQRINKTPEAVVKLSSEHLDFYKSSAAEARGSIQFLEEPPMLREPEYSVSDPYAGELTPRARETRLIGTLALLAKEITEKEQQQLSNLIKLRQQVATKTYTELTETLDKALAQFDSTLTELNRYQTELTSLTDKQTQLLLEKQGLEEELSCLEPGTARYDEVIAQLAQKKDELSECGADISRAEAGYKRVFEASAALSDKIDGLREEINAGMQNLPLEMAVIERDKNINRAGRFVQYITIFLKLIDNANVKDVQHQAEVYKVTNEQRIKELTEQSEAIAKKNKATSILSKIISGLAALLGIVLAAASVFTGGSTLTVAIAMVSCVVSLADTITLLAADFSFMGKAMGWIQEKLTWLMEHTVSFLLEAVAKGFSADDSTAADVKKYSAEALGTILTIALLIVPMLILAKNPGSALQASTQGAQSALYTLRAGALAGKMIVEPALQIAAEGLKFAATLQMANIQLLHEYIEQSNKARETAAELLPHVQEKLRDLLVTLMNVLEINVETAKRVLYETGHLPA